MKLTEYELQFQSILSGENNAAPYDSEDYLNYVKLNDRRIKRWRKNGKILPVVAETLKNIEKPLNWLLITEPWCGDAAHSHSFIVKMAELNPKINLTVQNRDAPNSEIDNYLTNGGKSIPKLIVRDADGKDLFVWGPRPAEAQEMVMKQKENASLSLEDKIKELQIWYNKDKGLSIQKEMNELLKAELF